MRWKGRARSENVEDRRGSGGGRVAAGGGLGMLVLVLVIYFLGGDPKPLLNQVQQGGGVVAPAGGAGAPGTNPEQDELAEFVAVVLRDTEDVWERLFREQGKVYEKPRLVLFTDQVTSACGRADASVGPFYCPGDSKVYLDLSFYEDLKRRFKAPGDFAQAYVVAHEIGHHVQNLLGISDQVHAMQGKLGKAEANELSVRLELQADFFAGVWAHHAENTWQILEAGDVEEALRCASAIGDDRLQQQSRGVVVPDSFTHGTSEQRVRWFRRGLASGDLSQGDTFSAEKL